MINLGGGVTSPLVSSITSEKVKGYQYSNSQKTNSSQQKSGFSFAGLVKEMLVGGLTGGIGSARFYGVDKAIQAIGSSIRNAWGSKSGSNTALTLSGSQSFQRYIPGQKDW